ncbi:glycogen/starch/alpha-glucan phosphorylase [Phormidium sp. FACHB-1136]|uniref:glycogen/starch/alpha-glucan phosphorylase n=1 Tax=Phormidium sp. FACHB-1136 TaxID=2692848 RepID=UPI001681E85F|nr:glycogen/starch/alpha-glucan phosphorylase [Phormidium sp. FACHB-1136]MBD2428954.1 glycogen/starch/alpha-glucan phosphorylase [Phormidium sp. FACHB-1136]
MDNTATTDAAVAIALAGERTGSSIDSIKRAFLNNLFFVQGKPVALATQHDYYMALAYLVRDRMLHRWNTTVERYTQQGARTVCYLSAEFLMGPHLGNNLINLGLYNEVKQAIEELGLDFDELLAQEEEPGLGNGGLGRLAACYLDSMASLEIPSLGYGIRYEFGIFHQDIKDGWQVERTDKWLRNGNPWEVVRPEWAVEVKFGGHTETYTDDQGRYRVRWVPEREVLGVPYDTPILGYQVNTANTLRLWKAEAIESFDFEVFNQGNYYGAVEKKVASENLTKVLYPNDETQAGKQLRLEQQIFFVSCSLQDMFRILKGQGLPIEKFHEKFSIQLNDTHPAIASAELMRLLLDEHGLDWTLAWEITQKTFAYTNHTLLPEALEKWPISLFGKLLPRHLEIIYEINRRFLELVRMRFPKDAARLARMSLIDESGERYVRMANLACVSSHTINGVAALHSELLKQTVLRDFYELFPEKFCNVTNGVTPRRWVVLSNPRLSTLITSRIGDRWIKHLDELKQLEPLADDSGFRQEWHDIKQAVKRDLAGRIHDQFGILVDPASLFDVQVKRIHEYKRQHLNVLHIVTLYSQLKQNPNLEITPRTFIFAGKAAPGYAMAKLMIKLITAVGDMVNKDPDLHNKLKVIFLPNYNVTNSQRIYPASDLSEQISTAGYEASGTGNMKFAMNGALTIGTLDGANVEIRDAVGAENFFLFGLTADQVVDLKAQGYNPYSYYQANPLLKDAIDLIASGHFSQGDGGLFKPLLDKLLYQDPYLLLADYQAYLDCQQSVGDAYSHTDSWTRMSILNAIRMGMFSSDRSVRDYCDGIWKASPLPITLTEYTDGDFGLGNELTCRIR